MAVVALVAMIAQGGLTMIARVTDQEIKELQARLDTLGMTKDDWSLLLRVVDQIAAEVTGNES